MAVRAGRRGKDIMGQVIYLPEREPPTVSEMKLILKGGRPEIQSRMDFHYDFLLKIFQTNDTNWLNMQEKSYWYCQKQNVLENVNKHIEEIKSKLEQIKIPSDVEQELEEKAGLNELIRTTGNAKRRDAQRRLDRWIDEHRGPTWQKYDELLETRNKLQTELGMEESYIKEIESTVRQKLKYCLIQYSKFMLIFLTKTCMLYSFCFQ
jgi:superfamily II RNA helicase